MGHRAQYLDGVIVASRPGEAAEPKPCAGVRGTTIQVEDLFYNMANRRKALKSPLEEFQRVLDVMSRYAIHSGGKGVSFTCKKVSVAVAHRASLAMVQLLWLGVSSTRVMYMGA